jgi:Ca2+/Na+ antiporter
MKFVLSIKDLALLTLLLFVVYFFFLSKREKLENTSESKECSHKTINEAYNAYVFGTTHSVR